MPYKEQVLREKTFREEGMEIEKRVFYTLTSGAEVQGISDPKTLSLLNSKLLGLLVMHLRTKALISDSEIDQMLLDCIH